MLCPFGPSLLWWLGWGAWRARGQDQQDKWDRLSCWSCPASLLHFATLLCSSPVLFVLFLKCFSHPWEKLQKSPAGSRASVLSHREQNHWVLMVLVPGAVCDTDPCPGTRGCVCSAGQDRGERAYWNGMGSHSESGKRSLQRAGRGCVRRIAKCYPEWE